MRLDLCRKLTTIPSRSSWLDRVRAGYLIADAGRRYILRQEDVAVGSRVRGAVVALRA